MKEELKFIKLCIKGCKRSWEEFVLKYSKLIYNYIYCTLRLKGFNLGNDIVQDIFQGIFLHLIEDNYRRLRNFKGNNGCKFPTWLRTVTINYTIDYMRKSKLTLSLDEEKQEGESLLEIVSDDEECVEEKLDKKERIEQLKDCIKKLNIEEKYFIEFILDKELKSEEIMRFFKVSRGALDMRKQRIILKLKECFRSKGFNIA